MADLANLRRLFTYCYRILKESRVAGDVLFDIRGDGRNFVDLSLFFDSEPLISHEAQTLLVRRSLVDTRIAELREREAAEDPAVIQKGYERLLHIYDQMLNNPYELDLVYAYLFAVGQDPDEHPVVAPLYLVPVTLQYDERGGALKIECRSDEARVNLYGLAALVPQNEQLIIDGLNSSPYLHLPATLEEINTHLNRLSELQSVIEARPIRNTNLQSPFDSWKPDLPPGKYALRRTGALALIRKNNVYLIRDLEQLQKMPDEPLRQSIVARFALGDEPEGETTSGISDDLILPFPASEAQRTIARLALKHKMMLVQGPPGTGKSHTISNLICHLVAQGKSVLVTSQKNKALEVVDQKLGTLKLDNLHITLLKDDRESKKRVKQIVEDLVARYSGVDGKRFQRTAEQRLAELRAAQQRLDQLKQEFAASRRFESEKAPGVDLTNGQVFAASAKLRGFDLLSQRDEVAWDQQEPTQLLIKQVVEAHLALGADLAEAQRFVEKEHPPAEAAAFLADLAEVEKLLHAESAAGTRADIERFLAKHAELPLSDPAALEKVEGEIRRAADEIRQLHESASRLEASIYQALLQEFGHSLGDQAEIDAKKLSLAQEELKQIEACEEQSKDLSLDSIDKEALREALLLYRAKKGSVLRFLSGEFSRAKRLLQRVCAVTTPELTERHELLVEARVKAMDLADRLNRRLREELAHLKLPERKAFCRPAEAMAFRTGLEERRKLLEVLSELQFIENQLRVMGLPNIQLDRIGDAAYFEQVHSLLLKIAGALRAVVCRLRAEALLRQWEFARRWEGFQAWQRQDVSGYRAARVRLERAMELAQQYRRLVELEQSAPNLAGTWKALRADPMLVGQIYSDIDRVVRCCALRTLMRKLDASAPRTTAQVAADVRRCEDEILSLMARTAAARLEWARASNLAVKAVNNTVTHFAKILQRGAKNYKAFEELKSQTDFRALLKVLPCWICGISDVARIFPLVGGLFDYLIVDEASQCFLPSSIPILFRAKHAIVVGDDQQLPNAEAGYISKEFSRALMTELKLEALPRSSSFDATENSLYDLVVSFKDRSVFLDEHFRCNPEIIAFSNARFYNNRLKIATEGMSRSLGKPLQIIQVADAPDDPERQVNVREAERILGCLVDLIQDPTYKDQTIGVCSLFREQADYIADLVAKRIGFRDRLKHQIIASTADGFQGDERDVILFSFRFAPNSPRGIFTFMQTADGQKRANVAFTRARKQVICFVSAPLDAFPQGIVLDFLRYVADPKSVDIDIRPWESEFESSVQEALRRMGLKVFPRYATCGFRVDLVAWDGKRKPLAIECDGWEYFKDDDGVLREEEVYRQSVLERAGWRVIRIPSRDYYRDRSLALSPIGEYFR